MRRGESGWRCHPVTAMCAKVTRIDFFFFFLIFGHLSHIEVSYHSHVPLEEASQDVEVGNCPEYRAESDFCPDQPSCMWLKMDLNARLAGIGAVLPAWVTTSRV